MMSSQLSSEYLILGGKRKEPFRLCLMTTLDSLGAHFHAPLTPASHHKCNPRAQFTLKKEKRAEDEDSRRVTDCQQKGNSDSYRRYRSMTTGDSQAPHLLWLICGDQLANEATQTSRLLCRIETKHPALNPALPFTEASQPPTKLHLCSGISVSELKGEPRQQRADAAALRSSLTAYLWVQVFYKNSI